MEFPIEVRTPLSLFKIFVPSRAHFIARSGPKSHPRSHPNSGSNSDSALVSWRLNYDLEYLEARIFFFL